MLLMWVPSVIALVVSVAAIVAVRPVAFRLALVDRPGGRKIHDAEVPVVGGLGMFLGLFIAIGVLPIGLRPPNEFAAVCAIFVVIGLLDDRFGLSPLLRLVVQFAATIWIAMATGTSAQFLGTLSAHGPVVLMDEVAVVLTGVLVAGGVNAFNMIDGIDGLAGSIGLIAMVSIAALAFDAGLASTVAIALIASGALAAFLVFNLPLRVNRPIRCFMGDAGSLLIGFVVAWLILGVSQNSSSGVEPAVMLFAVAVPISDLFWVFIYRMRRGQSPFRADNSHLHHYLLKSGASHAGALSILAVCAVAMSCLGLALNKTDLPGFFSFGIFIIGCCAVVAGITQSHRWVIWLPNYLMDSKTHEVSP
jgi:UDP-GlcNAc:undecaprenyl-phosphate GlcNAc-1-phosphate transferase